MSTPIKNILLPVFAALLLCFSNSSYGQRYKDRGQQEDNTDYRESQNNRDSLSNKSFAERLVYGGNFQLELGTTSLIDISPLVGYMLSPKWQAGVGATYIYYGGSVPIFDQFGNITAWVKESATYFGGRLYTQYDFLQDLFRPGDKLFGHFEYEALNVPYYYNYGSTGRAWIESPYVGAGYRTPFGRKGYFNLTFLYNIDYVRFANLNPYASPLSVRIGFTL